MWALTARGLSYFDGREFKLVLEEEFNLGFSKNKICFEDLDGELWLSGRVQKDSVAYKLVNTKTRAIRTPKEKYGTAFPKKVHSVFPGKKGSLWITIAQGSLLDDLSKSTLCF